MISRLRWEIRRSNRWSQSTVEWEITRSNRWLESRVQMRWQSSLRFRGYIFIWIVLVGGLPSFYCFWNVFILHSSKEHSWYRSISFLAVYDSGKGHLEICIYNLGCYKWSVKIPFQWVFMWSRECLPHILR